MKDTGFEGAPRERVGRNFRFNPKGKYAALGNQMRQENQLEALKQRIAESARKAGLDGEMGVEKAIKVKFPPTMYASHLTTKQTSVLHLLMQSGGTSLFCRIRITRM